MANKKIKKIKSTYVEDQYLCVVVNKYIYRNLLFYYRASKVSNLSTLCGEIRQTLDAKMRQLFQVNKSAAVYATHLRVFLQVQY